MTGSKRLLYTVCIYIYIINGSVYDVKDNLPERVKKKESSAIFQGNVPLVVFCFLFLMPLFLFLVSHSQCRSVILES